MTKFQFNGIVSELLLWRYERKLTKESQRKGYLGNVYEEVSEYHRANTDYDRIDALCDIAVFTLNAFDIDYDEDKSQPLSVDMWNIVAEINKERLILSNYVLIRKLEGLAQRYGFSFYHCMLETIKEISSRTGHYDNKINKFIKDKGAYNKREARKSFFVSYIYKEDKDYWYFLTLKGKKKIKKWYKADYSKCMLDNAISHIYG